MRGYIKDRTYYKYEKESGKLKMGGGSWTIKMDEFKPDDVDGIRYITDYAIYDISMDKALNYGFLREFKKEVKLVVPIKYWIITFKKGVEADERERKATGINASGDLHGTGQPSGTDARGSV